MKKHKGLIIGLLTLIVVLGSGCAREKENEVLKIGVMSDLGAAPFIIAEEKGYFEDLGVDVEITVFKSATDRDTAMQTGNLDGAMADMLTIVFYSDADFKAKMTSQTYGSYVMVTSPKVKKSDFESAEAINIGISANTVIDFATDQIALNNAFADKIETVAIPQMPVRLEMLGAGELMAATLPEPLATVAVGDGGEAVASTLDLGLQPGVFIFTEAAIDDQKEAIEKMYEGYNQAVNYINTTDQTEFMDLLVEKLGFPPTLKAFFDFPELSTAQMADEVTFRTVLSWMNDKGITTSNYEFADVSTDQFIKK